MNLDELQSVQARERQTDSLQQLRASFYKEAGEFVRELRERREEAADRADDPFDSPEVNRLTDDITTAESTVEAIYERRVGKVVKMASLAAADMPTEEEGLTAEESELFETLVDAIEANREHVLDVIAGEAPTGAVADEGAAASTTASEPAEAAGDADAATPSETPGEAASPDADGGASTDGDASTDGVSAADVMGGGDAADDPSAPPADATPDDAGAGSTPSAGRSPASESGADGTDGAASDGDAAEGEDARTGPDVDRTRVRITEDVGAIFGVDEREYDLSTDDVVTLPAANAGPLVERDAAEPLE